VIASLSWLDALTGSSRSSKLLLAYLVSCVITSVVEGQIVRPTNCEHRFSHFEGYG
jgi:hypothetical protein